MPILISVLSLLLLALGLVMLTRSWKRTGIGIKCMLRGKCNPARQPMGGFRCIDCGAAGGDMGDFLGWTGMGYVAPLRRGMDKDRRGSTVVSGFGGREGREDEQY